MRRIRRNVARVRKQAAAGAGAERCGYAVGGATTHGIHGEVLSTLSELCSRRAVPGTSRCRDHRPEAGGR